VKHLQAVTRTRLV